MSFLTNRDPDLSAGAFEDSEVQILGLQNDARKRCGAVSNREREFVPAPY